MFQMYKIVSQISRLATDSGPLYFSRCMASGRNVYIKGGSNKQDIPSETKKLIQNARDPDDYSWQLGYGIQEAREVDLTTPEKTRATQYKVKYKGHRILGGGEDKIKYFPHAGEELPNEPPSPVLMVEKLKAEKGQPYWIKDYLQQVGLGSFYKPGHKAFLPNTPSVGMILIRIKHMVKITPLTFPNGIPDDFDPNTHGYSLSATGEFTITDVPKETPESIAARAHWMKIDYETINKYHRQQWRRPHGTPLGNNNYYMDSKWQDQGKAASTYEKNKPKNRKWD